MKFEKSINQKQLESRNGRYYEKDKGTPYTGNAINYYENGEIERKHSYKNGLLNGEWTAYYKSGQVFYEGNYKNGERDGEWISYYENGEIKIKENYKNGITN